MKSLTNRFASAVSGAAMLATGASAEIPQTDMALMVSGSSSVTLSFGDIALSSQSLPYVTSQKCHVRDGQYEYLQQILVNDSVATQFVDYVDDMARTVFPRAYKTQPVSDMNQSDVVFLQGMLMRAGCYEEGAGRQDDGIMGDGTRAAITSFLDTYGHEYANLNDSILYDGETITGVNGHFLKTISQVAAKGLIYSDHLIRNANINENGFNEFSYRLALFKEFRGDYMGDPKPDYEALVITESDIDVAARTLYGEARGESRKGQIAVAHNILNRTITAVLDGYGTPVQFKSTITATCKSGNGSQYNAWKQGDPNYKKIQALDENSAGDNNALFGELKKLVRDVFAGKIADPTRGADHYHTVSVHPGWASGQAVVYRAGAHKFYDMDPQIDRMNMFLGKVLPTMNSIRYMRDWAIRDTEYSRQIQIKPSG